MQVLSTSKYLEGKVQGKRSIQTHNNSTLPRVGRRSFIFSDAYLKAVGSDLAINIFCAVANPLGAEGMVRIVKGALRSRDLRKDLLSMDLPLILVQVRNQQNSSRFWEQGQCTVEVPFHAIRIYSSPQSE